MKVIYRTDTLTQEPRIAINLTDWSHITPGTSYTVMGLTFTATPYQEIYLDIPGEFYIYPIPLCLFDILDPRPSYYWEARKSDEHSLTLWPKAFYIDSFHDRLSDFEPEFTTIYHEVRARLESEFD